MGSGAAAGLQCTQLNEAMGRQPDLQSIVEKAEAKLNKIITITDPKSSVIRYYKRVFWLNAPKILFGNADAGNKFFSQLKLYIVLDQVTI